MRRFTYEAGTSAKFWQITRSGTSVTVTYGRLGTQGQTKVKDFTDDASAVAHVESLVAEKLRKGYSEETATAGEAPPAEPAAVEAVPQPEPEASPQPKAVPTEDEWQVPSSWHKEIPPFRGVDPVGKVQLDPTAYEAMLARDAEKVRSTLQHPKTPADLREAGLAVLADPAVDDAVGHAAIAAILLPPPWWEERQGAEVAMVASWWQAHPPELAVAATLSLMPLIESGSGAAAHLLRTRRAKEHEIVLPHAMRSLRTLLGGVDDATYLRVEEFLATRVADPDALVVAAYLIPTRQDWVRAAAAAGPGVLRFRSLWFDLLASVRAAEDAQAVLDECSAWVLNRDPWVVTAVAAHVGPAAAPALLGLLENAKAPLTRKILNLVASLPGDESFGGLLSRLDAPRVSEAVLAAKELQPHRATRLLAEAAAARGRTADRCTAILSSHLVAHPATAAVAAQLSPAGRVALEAALPQESAVPVARPDALPPGLQQAPWEREHRVAEPVVVSGLQPSVPTRVVWELFEDESWRMPPWPGTYDWDRRLGSGHGAIGTLAVAPPEVGRAYLAAMPPRVDVSCSRKEAEGLLALHETAAVPLLLAAAKAAPSVAPALMPVQSLEVAELMASLAAGKSPTRHTGEAWLRRHRTAAAQALIPAALSKPGRRRRLAEHGVRLLAELDRAEVEQVAQSYGPKASAGIAAVLAVEEPPPPAPALPAWLDVRSLPPVLVADGTARLDVNALERLLGYLVEPHLGVGEAVAGLDAGSVADFARAVLEAWHLAGEPSTEGWALRCQAHVGDDETARVLTPWILTWPQRSGYAKAETGLSVLAGIGTDGALMHLHRVSLRASSRPLRDKATAVMNAVADGLGLSAEQLADRLVPNLGLDADGRTVLDYGPRRFTVGFDESLKPYVEEDGKRRTSLPKPGAKDDPQLAPAAYARFTALKKDVRTVASDQLRRLETAMAQSRRWTAGEHRRLFREHPLLQHLARRLVWGVYDDSDPLQASFRIAEDGTLADRDDRDLTLPDSACVGIAHPVQLGDQVSRWAELFADYELLQPFPQLAREVLHLTDDERAGTTLTRFASTRVEPRRLLGLASRGWHRADAEDAGSQNYLFKVLPHGLLAVVDLDPGLPVGMPDAAGEQRLPAVHLHRAPGGSWSWGPSLPWRELDEVSASEVLRDLTGVVQA